MILILLLVLLLVLTFLKGPEHPLLLILIFASITSRTRLFLTLLNLFLLLQCCVASFVCLEPIVNFFIRYVHKLRLLITDDLLLLFLLPDHKLGLGDDRDGSTASITWGA